VAVHKKVVDADLPAFEQHACADIGGIADGFVHRFVNEFRAIQLIIGSEVELHIEAWTLLIISGYHLL